MTDFPVRVYLATLATSSAAVSAGIADGWTLRLGLAAVALLLAGWAAWEMRRFIRRNDTATADAAAVVEQVRAALNAGDETTDRTEEPRR